MAQKLFVGNLPFNTTSEELQEFFAQAGSVTSANVITDKMTGRSRGFGFVEMSSDEEAEKAVEMLNNKDLGGRNVVVNVAKPMGERPPRRGGFGGGRGDRRDFGGRDSY
ncbi:MAG: RNA-binding protein [Candidatus Liptonbacteria bacterium]|nr:RNA-binding protein [Candidatus Liptonbacteria bacterium]